MPLTNHARLRIESLFPRNIRRNSLHGTHTRHDANGASCEALIERSERGAKQNGWGGGIRTPESRDQNPLPYHLATPHYDRDHIRSFTPNHLPAHRSSEGAQEELLRIAEANRIRSLVPTPNPTPSS